MTHGLASQATTCITWHSRWRRGVLRSPLGGNKHEPIQLACGRRRDRRVKYYFKYGWKLSIGAKRNFCQARARGSISCAALASRRALSCGSRTARASCAL